MFKSWERPLFSAYFRPYFTSVLEVLLIVYRADLIKSELLLMNQNVWGVPKRSGGFIFLILHADYHSSLCRILILD